MTIRKELTFSICFLPCQMTQDPQESILKNYFIPSLQIEPIHPELNVTFITKYLSSKNGKNQTRPFYQKTITLYPELEGVCEIVDEEKRLTLIREAVEHRLQENKEEITKRMEHFKEVFDSFLPYFLEAQCKLFQYHWKEEQPVITCSVGYLPFYPRSAEDKLFFVSYQDEERVFSGAVHEINHMIFWEKWKEMHGELVLEPVWPDPLWYLQEIIVDPTLNDERVKPFTLYENRAYPQFYEKDPKTGLSIMDLVRECYAKTQNHIEDFLEEAYQLVQEWCLGDESI